MTDYLAARTRLIWIAYPKTRTVTEYKLLDDVCVLTEGDLLDGGEVVPGFSMKISDLFA